MPTKSKNDTVVFSADAAKLTDVQLKELQSKFGLKLQVRSNAAAVTNALGKLGEVAVQNFDRTAPGYDRGFDRTGTSGLELGAAVINPVDLEAKIQNVAKKIISERGKPIR